MLLEVSVFCSSRFRSKASVLSFPVVSYDSYGPSIHSLSYVPLFGCILPLRLSEVQTALRLPAASHRYLLMTRGLCRRRSELRNYVVHPMHTRGRPLLPPLIIAVVVLWVQYSVLPARLSVILIAFSDWSFPTCRLLKWFHGALLCYCPMWSHFDTFTINISGSSFLATVSVFSMVLWWYKPRSIRIWRKSFVTNSGLWHGGTNGNLCAGVGLWILRAILDRLFNGEL